MKKIVSLVLGLVVFPLVLFSQITPLQEWLRAQKQDGKPLPVLNLFEEGSGQIHTDKWGTYTSLDLDLNQVKDLYTSQIQHFYLTIPNENGQSMVLELAEYEVMSEDFLAMAASQEGVSNIEFQKPREFRGVLLNSTEPSIATLTLSENGLRGLFSFGGSNYNLGPQGNISGGRDYFMFSDQELKLPIQLNCGVEEEYDPHGPQNESVGQPEALLTNCIRVRLEVNYGLYTTLGGTVQEVIEYVAHMFNSVATIYFNEDITFQVSQIHIWTGPDPYPGGSSADALHSFGDAIQDAVGGDLAHLMATYPGNNFNGGRGWVSALCTTYDATDSSGPYAYSNVDGVFDDFPTYSWDVMVMTHEMGHNLGSSHTHDCVWDPGGISQIDDCGNVWITTNGEDNDGDSVIDNVEEAEPCYDQANPILPVAGGTIMSYCHLNAVGINLANGFGPQPGNLIRNNVITAPCLASCSGLCDAGLHLFEPITTATAFEASVYILASNAVSVSAGVVKYDAGEFIELIPGFSAKPSLTGSFRALIDGCGGTLIWGGNNSGGANGPGFVETTTEQNFLIYPNPTSGNLTVQIDLPEPIHVWINILDATGKALEPILFSQTMDAGHHQFNKELNLQPGIYILAVQLGDSIQVHKLAVIRG